MMSKIKNQHVSSRAASSERPTSPARQAPAALSERPTSPARQAPAALSERPTSPVRRAPAASGRTKFVVMANEIKELTNIIQTTRNNLSKTVFEINQVRDYIIEAEHPDTVVDSIEFLNRVRVWTTFVIAYTKETLDEIAHAIDLINSILKLRNTTGSSQSSGFHVLSREDLVGMKEIFEACFKQAQVLHKINEDIQSNVYPVATSKDKNTIRRFCSRCYACMDSSQYLFISMEQVQGVAAKIFLQGKQA